jgi:fatty-acid desaturase
MYTFSIPPDSPLVDGRETIDIFAWDHALIIVGMHVLALSGAFFFSWQALATFLVFHVLCLGLGVVVCYHRLLSHQTFRCKPWVLYTLSTLGVLGFQGGPLLWTATHRAHHKHTDDPGDAHASSRGFWWSHMGWTFYRRPNGFRYGASRKLISDLLQHRYLVLLDRYAILANLLAAGLFFLVFQRIDLLIWAFPVRIVIDWHLTWLINSYAHFAPVRGPKEPRDEIRNSRLLAAIVFGEGWHANHHRFPGRANFAVEKGEMDPGFFLIRALERFGLLRVRRDTTQNTYIQPSN